jgi:hypothetical protein
MAVAGALATLSASKREAGGRTEMDPITMLILAIAMLLTMNVVASYPQSDRQS